MDHQAAAVLPPSGVGPGDIIVEIPESAATEASIEINVAVYSAAPSDDATSDAQILGFPIRLPRWVCRLELAALQVPNGISPALTASDPPARGTDIGRYAATVAASFTVLN